jgi:two-component system chemotaxis response regulator CheY
VVTVLLVEDDVALRRTVADMLRGAGHAVIEAGIGEAAIADVRQQSYDLLLSDIVMPAVDGVTVIETARRHRPDLPIIAMSGGSGFMIPEVGLRWSKAAGANRLLRKPFRREELLAAIADLLPPGKAD